MKTKKDFKPDIGQIIKNNKNIDTELLKRSMEKHQQLKDMGVTPKPYNFVLPYSRSVTVDK